MRLAVVLIAVCVALVGWVGVDSRSGPDGPVGAELVVESASVLVSPGTRDFGQQAVGAGRTDFRKVWVHNISADPVVVDGISFGGTDASEFVLSSTNCETIPVDGSCVVRVRFDPSSVGEKTATLVAETAVGADASSGLAGEGVLPLIGIKAAQSDFGTRGVLDGASDFRKFWVRNGHDAPIDIGPISFDGDNPAQFVLSSTNCATLAAGGSCVVRVRFDPSSQYEKNATLEVGASVGGPASAALSGYGTGPILRVRPSGFDFGFQEVNSGPTDFKKFWVRNGSGDPVDVGPIFFGGRPAEAGDFVRTSTSCGTLAAGASCVIRAKFDPSSTGRKFADLVVDSSAGGQPGTAPVAGDGYAEPVADDDSDTVEEDDPAAAVDVLSNDTDEEGDSITIVSATDPANGTVALEGPAGEHAGLTYEPDADYCNEPPGGAPDTFDYTVNGGDTATVSITVECVNDPPVADDESFENGKRAVGNTALVVDDPSDGAPNPSGPQKTVTGDILDGDTDTIDGPGPLVAVAESKTLGSGATVAIEADGDFTYQPPTGCDAATDSFDYSVSDQHPTDPRTDTGTVTIAIADCVWYADANASTNGDGRSDSPFNTLAASGGAGLDGAGGSGDSDAPAETLFLYPGTYTGGLVLEGTQGLYTKRHGLVVSDGAGGGLTLESGDAPGAGSTLTGGLALAAGNTIQGLHLGDNGSGPSLSGTSVGTFILPAVMNTVTGGSINNTTGAAVDIDGGELSMAFTSVSSSAGTSGINIDDAAGSFTANGGTLSGATGPVIDIDGGFANVTYAGAIGNGADDSVEITGRQSGAVSLTGNINDTGDPGGGIDVSGNSGGSTTLSGGTKTLDTGASPGVTFTGSDGHTLSFTNGGLDIDTTSAQGLHAASSGTLAVTGGSNTIDASALGTGADCGGGGAGNCALNVSDTDFGEADATFQRISASGGRSGIRLNNTGAAGNLAITGNGGDHSGGTIQNTSGNGIDLRNTRDFNADEMNLSNTATDGVSGTGVNNFTFTDSTIANAGQSDASTLDSAFGFNTQVSANENNIDGNVAITGNTITTPFGSGVAIFNHNGTISDLNISNNNMTSATQAPQPGGGDSDTAGDGIQVVAFGGDGFAADVTKATVSNNNITGFPDGSGIEFLGGSQGDHTEDTNDSLGEMGTPGSATDRIVISGNDIDGFSTANPMLTAFIVFDIEGRARGHAVIQDNGTAGDRMTNVAGNPIAVGGAGGDLPPGQVELELHVLRNFLTPNETPLSAGASGIGLGTDKDGIASGAQLSDFDVNAEISNNQINLSDRTPIRILHRDQFGTLNLKLIGNVAGPSADDGNGAIRVENGSSGNASFGSKLCAQIENNMTVASGPDGFGAVRPGITLLDRDTTDPDYEFGVVGLSPSPTNQATVEGYVSGKNPASNFGTGPWAGKRTAADNGANWHSCSLPSF